MKKTVSERELSVDSLQSEEKENWKNISISANYRISFKVIDHKILVNLGEGNLNEFVTEKYLEQRQLVIKEAFPDNRYFVELISQAKLHNSAPAPELKKLHDYYNKENQCLGYLLYNNGHGFKTLFKKSSVFNLRKSATYQIVRNYEEGLAMANQIFDKYTTAIDDKNKLKILKEWNYTYEKGTFSARLCACADNIMYVKYEGEGDEESGQGAIAFQEKIFSEGWIIGPTYLRIADYSKFNYGSRKLRENYAKSINKLHEEYNCTPERTFIIGASTSIRVAVTVLQFYLNLKTSFVKSLEEAVENIYNNAGKRKSSNDYIQVKKTDIAEVIRQMGKIAWSLLDKKESKQIADVHPLKELHDAIQLISEDYGSILQELDKKNKLLNEAVEEAIIANKQKSEFLSIMTHEIRTPLNAIIGLNQYLLDTNPREDQLENLQTINYSSNHLFHLVNDILDFNKIEAGKIKLEMVVFEFRKLITNLFTPYKFWSKDKKIDYLLDIDPTTPSFLICDPTRLSQVLTNLIGNAIKFTETGHVKLKISNKGIKNNSANLLFEVEDTGIGIAKENFDKIFEKYEQETASTTRKFGGTGLGLSISKSLVELLGSSIHIKSELGKGTTFYFELALEIGSGETEKIKIPKPSLIGTRVLLVEDNLINVKVADQYLKKLEITADIANNGIEALEMIKNNDYDIVLMDLLMPKMDGYEATREIRKMTDDRKATVPIVALTASSLSEVYQKFIDAGMIDHICKPFSIDELHMKILKYSRKKQGI